MLEKERDGEPRDEGRFPSKLRGDTKPQPGRTFSKEGLHVRGEHLREMKERSRKSGLGHRVMPIMSSSQPGTCRCLSVPPSSHSVVFSTERLMEEATH